MEIKKNSIKDKIALFNQFSSTSSKNENNLNKPVTYNKGFNILDNKFPELKKVKTEEKKEIKQKEEKIEKEIKKEDIKKDINVKRKEEIKKEENIEKKIEEKINQKQELKKEENIEKKIEAKIEKKEEIIDKKIVEKIDKKEEFKTEENVEKKNENNDKNIIKESERKEDKKLEKKEIQKEKNIFNEKRENLMNFLIQQDKTTETISKNKNNNEEFITSNSDKENIQKINCYLNKPFSLEILKEVEKIITTTILITENNNEDIKSKTIMLRRYNEETIKLGKQFFKNRFLNKKIQIILQNENNKKENNIIRIFDIEKIKKKYLKLYLNKVEKAIFCFS